MNLDDVVSRLEDIGNAIEALSSKVEEQTDVLGSILQELQSINTNQN